MPRACFAIRRSTATRCRSMSQSRRPGDAAETTDEGDLRANPTQMTQAGDDDRGTSQARKYYVDGVEVRILAEQVQYLGANGELITESFTDYTGENLTQRSIRRWTSFPARLVQRRTQGSIVAELLEQGVFLDKLQEDVGLDLDPFDLICHVAFDRKALTRSERANKRARSRLFREVRRHGAQGVGGAGDQVCRGWVCHAG